MKNLGSIHAGLSKMNDCLIPSILSYVILTTILGDLRNLCTSFILIKCYPFSILTSQWVRYFSSETKGSLTGFWLCSHLLRIF